MSSYSNVFNSGETYSDATKAFSKVDERIYGDHGSNSSIIWEDVLT